MKIINKSRKIIGINGEALLPGRTMELQEGYESHPAIAAYLKKGIIADADNDMPVKEDSGVSDFEKARIAEEAIARYKEEQEALAAAQKKKQAEIDAVKAMKKKADLLLKAAGMGLEVKDEDTAEALKEKIMAALG